MENYICTASLHKAPIWAISFDQAFVILTYACLAGDVGGCKIHTCLRSLQQNP